MRFLFFILFQEGFQINRGHDRVQEQSFIMYNLIRNPWKLFKTIFCNFDNLSDYVKGGYMKGMGGYIEGIDGYIDKNHQVLDP